MADGVQVTNTVGHVDDRNHVQNAMRTVLSTCDQDERKQLLTALPIKRVCNLSHELHAVWQMKPSELHLVSNKVKRKCLIQQRKKLLANVSHHLTKRMDSHSCNSPDNGDGMHAGPSLGPDPCNTFVQLLRPAL